MDAVGKWAVQLGRKRDRRSSFSRPLAPFCRKGSTRPSGRRKFAVGIGLVCVLSAISPVFAERGECPAPVRSVTISAARDFSTLEKSLGSDGMLLLQKINRRDKRHLQKKGTVIVPEKVEDFLDYSPFPLELIAAAPIEKVILVSLRHQAFAAYEKGRQIRWGPVSSGIESQPTPPTLYHVNWKSRRRISSLNPSWIMPWYSNLHLSMGVGFHQYAMPGRPASHGCLRLLREDARWIFEWSAAAVFEAPGVILRHGTPTIVFGKYDYERDPPWLDLQEGCRPPAVAPEAIEAAMKRYRWALLERSPEP